MINNITLVLIIIILFVSADKVLTAINIHLVKTNFPNADPLSIEKNPVAKLFFEKLGILAGSIVYGIISLLIALIAFILLTKAFNEQIALYVICIAYGLVIANNAFFMLRFAKVIG